MARIVSFEGGVVTYRSMSANETLRKIPVVVHSASNAPRGMVVKGLEWKRRAMQMGTLILLVLIPVMGVFRIDTSAGFVVLGHQVWFSDFSIVFGFWLAAACLLVMFYSTLGTAFCGWVCPQNTLSAWANKLTFRHLGKRAALDWEGAENARVSAGKNKTKNWLILGGKLLLASLGVALLPMLYFYEPEVVWSFVTLRDDQRVIGSLYLIYSVFVLLVLGNLAVMRYYICRYTCVYRIWQFLFKTRQTLHVVYDQSRSDECAKCNFCVTTCPVDIDPRNTLLFDSCTNCGECITACDSLHTKKGTQGLLTFEFGERKVDGVQASSNMASLTQRAGWAMPGFALGVFLLVWGMWNYQTYSFSVYRAETSRGENFSNYRVSIAHKMYKPGAVTLQVEGLPEGTYTLDATQAIFRTAERQDVGLHIAGNLAPGLYPFVVHAQSAEGWRKSFRVQHFVKKV